MILTPHILVGALIGAKVSNPIWVAILAFVSHFVLDIIPHWDYQIGNLEKKRELKLFLADAIKVFLDLGLGFIIVFLLLRNCASLNFTILGGIFAILPDALVFIEWQIPGKFKFLKLSNKLHKLIHLAKNLTPLPWGLSVQIVFILIIIAALAL